MDVDGKKFDLVGIKNNLSRPSRHPIRPSLISQSMVKVDFHGQRNHHLTRHRPYFQESILGDTKRTLLHHPRLRAWVLRGSVVCVGLPATTPTTSVPPASQEVALAPTVGLGRVFSHLPRLGFRR